MLAEGLGQHDEALRDYTQALTEFKRAGREIKSVDELKIIVERLDKAARQGKG
jgi:hypothetical protein